MVNTTQSPDLSKLKKINIYFMITLTCLFTLVSCSDTSSGSNPVNNTPIAEISTNDNTQNNASKSVVRFGILWIDSAVSMHDRYGPLVDYLSETTGRSFELVALNQDSQFTEVAEANLDFIANNPLAAVQVQRLYKTKFLTTLERPNTGTQFSALIVARSDSDIQTLSDLKGKKVACVDFETAAAGCLFQVYHLLQNNIDPFQDFAKFVENPSQDSIVLSLLNHTIDAGFIRTGQLERMLQSDLIDTTDEIKILDPKNGDFFFTHTTDLYPEWPIASLPSTDPELTEAVKKALLNMPQDHPAFEAANLTGFLPAENYESVHTLIETLQLKSWDTQ